MEANYFRNCKYPMMTSMQGSDVYAGGTTRDTKNNPTFSSEDGGSIKAYNNHMEGSYTFIPYGASKYVLKGSETAAGSIDTKADFDAYVVSSRNDKVPNTVKSYAGANTYNNFDTDNSVMYSYTADSPAQAMANVRAYAGRVQGGDFKWTFDNSVDDAAYEVNQKLKDALMAYKGSNGEVMEYASSSSVAPESSSSSVASSSSEQSSSSVESSSSEKSSSSVSSSSEKLDSSSSVENPESSSSAEGDSTTSIAATVAYAGVPMRYIASESRLEINADVRRLNIFDVNGHVVKMSTEAVSQSSVDLSCLKPGVYLVRLVAGGKAYQQKIVKW
jgi:hypothetical protein